jgi:hypothetical protein
MEIPVTLVFLTVLVLVVAFVVRPFAVSRESGHEKPAGRPSASALRRRADLLAGRSRVYHALRDPDFDHQTNKVADKEYTVQRCCAGCLSQPPHYWPVFRFLSEVHYLSK